MPEGVRLQKFLSQAGVASRRTAERWIVEGRVRVNGRVVTELGTRVDPAADTVEVDGRRITAAAPVWLALNKPVGYVSTRRDPQGRPTIYELLPEEYRGLFYVGRLDVDSEGLMLLTNQGDVAHRLLHPRFGVDRVYEVVVRGEVTDDDVARLLAGIELEDGIARARAVERVGPTAKPRRTPGPTQGRDRAQIAGEGGLGSGARRGRGGAQSRLRVTLGEGRKREVRRLFQAIGHPVRRLIRLQYGPVRLGELRPGAWRRLSAREIAALEEVGRRIS
jgi:pseudouridine synthase